MAEIVPFDNEREQYDVVVYGGDDIMTETCVQFIFKEYRAGDLAAGVVEALVGWRREPVGPDAARVLWQFLIAGRAPVRKAAG
jgi:hypothetical protein